MGVELLGGLSQGLAQGSLQGQRLQQQQDLVDLQKLQKQALDIEHKLQQHKLKYVEENPDALPYIMGVKKAEGPQDALRSKLMQEIFKASGLGLDGEGQAQPTVQEQQMQGQAPKVPMNWSAPSAEDVMNYLITGDTKDLVPPARTVDLGNQVGVMRGGRVVGTIPKATRKEPLEMELPGGAKGKAFYDTFNPPSGIVQTAPPKGESTSTEALKLQTLIGSIQDAEQFMGQIMDENGEIKPGAWKDLVNMDLGTPGTAGRGLSGLATSGLDVIARAKTGAAIRPDEWGIYKKIYIPQALDSDQTKKEKMARFQRDLVGAIELLDPNGTIRKRSSGGSNVPTLDLNPKQQQNKRMIYDGTKFVPK